MTRNPQNAMDADTFFIVPPARPKGEAARILIVDDHPIVRNGLAQLIRQEPGLTVCGEAGGAADAERAIAHHLPHLVLLDISMGGSNGIELTRRIRKVHPNVLVLVLSMHDENLYTKRALRAGARGYVTKHEPPERVIEAIHRVLSGHIFVSSFVAQHIIEEFAEGADTDITTPEVETLSDRELQIFELIGKGYSTREIAGALHLSPKTVESHRANIKKKMNVHTSVELMHYAIRWSADH